MRKFTALYLLVFAVIIQLVFIQPVLGGLFSGKGTKGPSSSKSPEPSKNGNEGNFSTLYEHNFMVPETIKNEENEENNFQMQIQNSQPVLFDTLKNLMIFSTGRGTVKDLAFFNCSENQNCEHLKLFKSERSQEYNSLVTITNSFFSAASYIQRLTSNGVTCIFASKIHGRKEGSIQLYLVCQVQVEPQFMMAAGTFVKLDHLSSYTSKFDVIFSHQNQGSKNEKNEKNNLSIWIVGSGISSHFRGQIQLDFPTVEEVKSWTHDHEFRKTFLARFDNFERNSILWKLEFSPHIEDALSTTEISQIALVDKEKGIYHIDYYVSTDRVLARGYENQYSVAKRELFFYLKKSRKGLNYYEQLVLDDNQYNQLTKELESRKIAKIDKKNFIRKIENLDSFSRKVIHIRLGLKGNRSASLSLPKADLKPKGAIRHVKITIGDEPGVFTVYQYKFGSSGSKESQVDIHKSVLKIDTPPELKQSDAGEFDM